MLDKTRAFIIAVIVTVVSVVTLICIPWKSRDAAPVAPVVAKQEPEATVQEKLAAVFRGHPNALKVCYEANYDGFFLNYKDAPLGEAGPVDRYWGWYFIQKVTFYRASNNMWFIVEQPATSYLRTYPDITGLNCKDTRD